MFKKYFTVFIGVLYGSLVQLQAQQFRLYDAVGLRDTQMLQIAGVVNDHVLLFSRPISPEGKAVFYSFNKKGKLLSRSFLPVKTNTAESGFLFWQGNNALNLLYQSADSIAFFSVDKNGDPIDQRLLETAESRPEPYKLLYNAAQQPVALYRYIRLGQKKQLQFEFRMLDTAGYPRSAQSYTPALSEDHWIPGPVAFNPDGSIYFVLSTIPETVSGSAQTALYRLRPGSEPEKIIKLAERNYSLGPHLLALRPDIQGILIASIYYDRQSSVPLGIRTISTSGIRQEEQPQVNWLPFGSVESSKERGVVDLQQLKPILRSVYLESSTADPFFLIDALPKRIADKPVYQTYSTEAPVIVSYQSPSMELEFFRQHSVSLGNFTNQSPVISYTNGRPVIAPVPAGYGGGAYSPLLEDSYTPPTLSESNTNPGNEGPVKTTLQVRVLQSGNGKLQVLQSATISLRLAAPEQLWHTQANKASFYLDFGEPSKFVLVRKDKKVESLTLLAGSGARLLNGFHDTAPDSKTIWLLVRTAENRLALGTLHWE